MLAEDKAFTLATSNFHTVFIFAVDIYNASLDERVTHTLKAANQPMGVPSVLIIDGTRVGDVRVYEDSVMQTVIQRWGTGGGNVPMIFPIDDGRELEKHQNGTGIGEDGAPAYTLDRLQAPAVAFSAGNSGNSYGIGLTEEGTPPLRAGNSGTNQVPTMQKGSVVRRLTPTECERLQGFPDGWTDGQADSHRYKQMGNAVAVPVVQWIINRIIK